MRIAEYEPDQRLVLRASPDENKPVPGCAIGCLIAMILPVIVAFTISAILKVPVDRAFMIAWGVVSGFGVLLLVLGYYHSSSMIRFDRVEGVIEWTLVSSSGRTKTLKRLIMDIRGFRLQMSRVRGRGAPLQVSLMRKSNNSESASFSFEIDWLATPSDLRDFGHRIAQILQVPKYQERREPERDRLVIEYVPDAALEVPISSPPLGEYGGDRFSDAAVLPGWSTATLDASWHEEVGVKDHLPGTRLELAEPPRARIAIRLLLFTLVALGGLAFLFYRPELLPYWIQVSLAVFASFLVSIGMTLFYVSLASYSRGMAFDGVAGVVEFTGGRPPEPLKFSQVRRVVCTSERLGMVMLDTDRGAITVPTTAGGPESSIKLVAVAKAISEILKVPCQMFELPEEGTISA